MNGGKQGARSPAIGVVGLSRRSGIEKRDRPPISSTAISRPPLRTGSGREYHLQPAAAGFLYLAVVLDAFSRKIVGWAMTDHRRSELVLDALEMAVTQRRPRDVIHHSQQGSQYTSPAFGNRCREAGVRPSMGSVGDAYDNAVAESFLSILECELLARRRVCSQAEARMACFSYIEGFYNPLRRHLALAYSSPIVYEHEAQPEPLPESLLSQAS